MEILFGFIINMTQLEIQLLQCLAQILVLKNTIQFIFKRFCSEWQAIIRYPGNIIEFYILL